MLARDIIYEAIISYNKRHKLKIDLNDSTNLMTDSKLDSLALLQLILSVESLTRKRTKKNINLADEKAFSLTHSPFKSVKTLIDFLEMKLDVN